MEIDPFALTRSVESARDATDGPGQLPRGTVVGRYMVLDRIGSGGMGSVYSAYDPELDRKIALKSLHAWSEDQTRKIVQEAKTMARLSHPNVVTVHDVLVDEGRVLIAMELVDGASLRDWLEASRRSWREVVAMFVQAGRGLSAAHEAGIVHRDFKPDNVLVGRDGRARVADFGLSRPASPERRPEPGDDVPDTLPAGHGSLESSLEGTPRYMAPEQIAGQRAGPAADQFGFCVSLWEALYGCPPFEGNDLVTILSRIREGRRQDGTRRGAPAWVRRLLVRGLSASPEARHASMATLADALARDPTTGRRRLLGASVAAAAVASVVALVAAHARGGGSCASIGGRLDGVWDAARKEAARAAIQRTGRPYAADAFARATEVLDARAAEWKAAAVSSCETPRVDPRRAECLEERLFELGVVGGALTETTVDTLEHVVPSARALPSASSCADLNVVADGTRPADPATRTAVTALEEDLVAVAALRRAGRAEGQRAARDVERAAQIGFAPVTAEALLTLGELQADGADPAAADVTLRRAAVAAEASGAGRAAARAWLDRAGLSSARADYPQADEQFDHAAAWIERIGNPAALRGELLLLRGERVCDGGDDEGARVMHKEALLLLERAGSDLVPRALNALGVDADMRRNYDEARDFYEMSLDRYARTLGPEHPSVAKELNNMGLMYADMGDMEKGVGYLERAYRIAVDAYGPDHPGGLVAAWNLAIAYAGGVHRYEDALALAVPALAGAERIYGRDNQNTGYALSAIVLADIGLNRGEEAVKAADRELAVRTGPDVAPAVHADALGDLGLALLSARRDLPRARALLGQAREIYVSSGRTQRLDDIDRALAE